MRFVIFGGGFRGCDVWLFVWCVGCLRGRPWAALLGAYCRGGAWGRLAGRGRVCAPCRIGVAGLGSGAWAL